MDTLQALFTRKSTREFSDKLIEDEKIETILRAGMSGPCCVNARDWSFVVVTKRETLDAMADANGSPAKPLRNATAAILVCADTERAFKPAPEYWVIDCAIAVENMVLAAHDLSLGSVWLGTWPQDERVKAQAELFDLPETAIPHSILALGYPKDAMDEAERDLYEAGRVHRERW